MHVNGGKVAPLNNKEIDDKTRIDTSKHAHIHTHTNAHVYVCIRVPFEKFVD